MPCSIEQGKGLLWKCFECKLNDYLNKWTKISYFLFDDAVYYKLNEKYDADDFNVGDILKCWCPTLSLEQVYGCYKLLNLSPTYETC